MWDEIANPFQKFNDCTIEVWEWNSNSTKNFTGRMITYPSWVQKSIHVHKRGSKKGINFPHNNNLNHFDACGAFSIAFYTFLAS